MFVDKRPSAHAALDSFECTTSLAPPIIDSWLAASDATVAVAALVLMQDADYQDRPFLVGAAVLSAAAVLVWSVSAVYGYTEIGKCRDATEAMYTRQAIKQSTSR